MSTREAVGRRDGDRFSTSAVKANGLVFTTGNIGPDADTGELPPDVESQTRNTLLRLQAVLEQAGSELAKVIKVNVYLDDIESEFDRMNSAYDDFFRENGITEPPARTTVGARLPWSKVEIDMVAAA
jgi:2-iminobutanoate/2-iminopropanoate deaminase